MLLHLQNLPREDFNSAEYLSKVVEGIRFPEEGQEPRVFICSEELKQSQLSMVL